MLSLFYVSLMVSHKLAYFTFLSTERQITRDFQITIVCYLLTLLREVRNTRLMKEWMKYFVLNYRRNPQVWNRCYSIIEFLFVFALISSWSVLIYVSINKKYLIYQVNLTSFLVSGNYNGTAQTLRTECTQSFPVSYGYVHDLLCQAKRMPRVNEITFYISSSYLVQNILYSMLLYKRELHLLHNAVAVQS